MDVKWNRMYVKHSSWRTISFSVKEEVKNTLGKWQTIKTNHIQILISFRSIIFSFNLLSLHSFLSILSTMRSRNVIIIVNPGTKGSEGILF